MSFIVQEVDACGCDNVCSNVVEAAVEALEARPRALRLRLGGTAAACDCSEDEPQENQKHKLLTVNIEEDLSNPNLRPDFVDQMFDYSSEDSLDDLYDHDLYDHDLYEDFDDFLGPADELLLDHDDDNELNGLYAYGIHAADIILL
ncbi:hypothetical protein evm_005434 [Chilo suppressalis]|nr:hypothetical protein evm_005434 [Chilo suppressalis]